MGDIDRALQNLELERRAQAQKIAELERERDEAWKAMQESERNRDRAVVTARHYEAALYIPGLKITSVLDGNDAIEISPMKVGEVIARAESLQAKVAELEREKESFRQELRRAEEANTDCNLATHKAWQAEKEAEARAESLQSQLVGKLGIDDYHPTLDYAPSSEIKRLHERLEEMGTAVRLSNYTNDYLLEKCKDLESKILAAALKP